MLLYLFHFYFFLSFTVVFNYNYFYWGFFQTKTTSRSLLDKFQEKVADLLKVDKNKLEIFNVQSFYNRGTQYTDIRFALPNTSLLSSVKLNGLLLMHREEVIS